MSFLTLSWRRPISYRNLSIDLQSKSVDWFLYDIGLHHERVKRSLLIILVRCLSIMFADIFTTFTEMLFDPVAFLASKLLINLFIWSIIVALIFSSAIGGNSFLILIMLGWFLNLSMIIATIFFTNSTC